MNYGQVLNEAMVLRRRGAPADRERVLFIATQFSNLYTAVDTDY